MGCCLQIIVLIYWLEFHDWLISHTANSSIIGQTLLA